MADSGKVTCPECQGEGVIKHCALIRCLTCRGEGELTPEQFRVYEQTKEVTLADTMRPRTRE